MTLSAYQGKILSWNDKYLQMPIEPSLYIDNSFIVFNTDLLELCPGYSNEVNITSNTSWTATRSNARITINGGTGPVTGTGNSTLFIGIGTTSAGSWNVTITSAAPTVTVNGTHTLICAD